MKRRVYLDHHATTPLDPRVLEAMMPYLTGKFGNAASRSHSFGWEAEKAVERARKSVAALAGCAPREIVFTSGATESVNLAVKGAVEAARGRGGHIVTAATEHRAVLDVCKRLEKDGVRVTVVAAEKDGRISPERIVSAIEADTVLVSIMYANNEIGVINPVHEIGAICRERGVLFHCDAAQAFGKVDVNVEAGGIGLMSISGHKLYGPKGIGALYVRRHPRVVLRPQMDGGGHEFGLRSGTLNVPAIVGFGEACAICEREMAADTERLSLLRDRLLEALRSSLDGVSVNGSLEHRLPHNLNVSFAFVDSESLLMSLPDLALSTGSACTSATVEPSHVLRAIGVPEDLAHSAVRFGLGRSTTAEEIEYAAARVVQEVRRLRELSPLYEIAGRPEVL
jgi:cysteine desulfurase